ncbi:MAG: sensor histidine kinase, partial [Mesorhizobium sp.]
MTSEVLSTDEKPRPAAASSPRRVPLSRGLSTKLLLLTIVFVLLAEILIFLPWIASYRVNWLKERLSTSAAVSI